MNAKTKLFSNAILRRLERPVARVVCHTPKALPISALCLLLLLPAPSLPYP